MAFLLRYNPSGGTANVTIPLTTASKNIVMEVDCSWSGIGPPLQGFGKHSNDRFYIGRFNGNLLVGIGTQSVDNVIALNVNQRYKINFTYNNGAYSISVDDVILRTGNIPVTSTRFSNLGFITAPTSTNFHGDLYKFTLIDNDNPVNNRRYNPSIVLTDPNILVDEISGNNGTLINFPADGTGRVFYDDGGGEPPVEETLIKYYNGTSWVAKPLKMWNGAAWVRAPLKRFNGTTWEQV